MRDIMLVLLAGLVADNLICNRLIGLTGSEFSLDTFRNSLLFGVSATAVSFISTLLCYPIFRYILTPLGGQYFYIFISVLITVGVFFAATRALPKVLRGFNYVHKTVLLATALGIVTICLRAGNMLLALLSSVFYGLGLLLTLCIFFCARLSLKESRVPAFFKGPPIDLIIIAIIALVFNGFKG